MNKSGRKLLSIFEIYLLIISLFAFCFIMNLGFVSAFSESLEQGLTLGSQGGTSTGGSSWGLGKSYQTNLPTLPGEGGGQVASLVEKATSEGVDKVAQGAAKTLAGKQSWLPKLFGASAGGVCDTVLSGAQWAGIAYFAGYMVGELFGLEDSTTTALSAGLAAGFGVGKAFAVAGQKGGLLAGKEGVLGWMGNNPALTGIGVGLLVFVLMYKETEYRIVTFNCLPWQAPQNGDDCELCNDDKYPCSEYRCKSLGQSCELVNAGTSEERCINNHRDDVDPPVLTPNAEELTAGHSYKNVKKLPPGPGFEIVSDESEDGCIKAFTPLRFGFTSNEPAQCKIDSESTDQVGEDAFEAMSYWVGGSNIYKYNHTEVFSLPGPASLEGENLTIANYGKWTFFVRCRDFNGNENEAEYAVRFCVDPSPDTTPPVVVATSMENFGYVPANTDKADVEFYINEPATCKWDFSDQSYESMEYDMTCAGNVYEMNSMLLYTCKAELTAIKRDGTDYFIRCKDQPTKPDNDRIAMGDGYEFNLKGSTELKIRNLQPNETVYGSTDPAKVELKVETLFGSENGKAICFYATEDNDGDYIKFLETEDIMHTQRQDLTSGTYTYYYKCVDSGGNVAKESTTFTVDVDTSAPVVARVYEDNGKLTVVTVKNSECSYSFDDCDFMFEEGINMPSAGTKIHIADWDEEKTYYIKCRDEFKNEEADCSVIVRPSRKL